MTCSLAVTALTAALRAAVSVRSLWPAADFRLP